MTPNTSGATQRNDPHDNLDRAHARQAVPVSVGIQPHGFLVCLNESSHVIQASENVKGLARRPLEQLLGAPLADLIGAEAAKRITESIGLEVPDGTPFYVGAITDP